MYFKQVQVGGFDNNFSYFIGDEKTREIAVVDPINLPLLEEIISKDDLEVVGIMPTHGHFDHTGETKEFQEKTGATVYLHPENPLKAVLPTENVILLSNGYEITIGESVIKAIFTPGHTPDSVCFLAGNKLITGDTLFVGGCGRCDLEGGDADELYESLFNVIGKLPDNTEIYPGHDYGDQPFSNIRNEKQKNRFYLADSKEKFKRLRLP